LTHAPPTYAYPDVELLITPNLSLKYIMENVNNQNVNNQNVNNENVNKENVNKENINKENVNKE